MLAAALLAAVFGSGCTLLPRGFDEERAALAGARPAPVPAGDPIARDEGWQPWVERALAAHGDVRAAWFAWKAAVQKVEGASAWPNTRLAVGYSRVFGGDAMGSARNMVDARPDSMANLEVPAKARAAGREALAEARAAGEQFRKAAASVRRRTLDAWLGLALAAEDSRLAAEAAALAGLASRAAGAATAASGSAGDALASGIAVARADDAVAGSSVEVHHAREMLAAAAAVAEPARIPLPSRLPAERTLPDEEDVMSAVADAPEVAAMRREREAAGATEDRARLEWIPDFNPAVTLAGGAEQAVGAMLMLPTTVVAIRSSIAAARLERRAAVARLAQARRDVRAEAAAALAAARDADRRRLLLLRRIEPAARTAAEVAAHSYAAGSGDLDAVIEARLVAVEARAEAAATVIERERALAALEETLGVPLEVLSGTGTRPGPGRDQLAAAPQEAPR